MNERPCIQLDPGSHGRADGDGLQVRSLGGSGAHAFYRVHQVGDIFLQFPRTRSTRLTDLATEWDTTLAGSARVTHTTVLSDILLDTATAMHPAFRGFPHVRGNERS